MSVRHFVASVCCKALGKGTTAGLESTGNGLADDLRKAPSDVKPLVLVVNDEFYCNRLCRAIVQRNWDASGVSIGKKTPANA